jgi:hypothetical protein
MGLFKSDEERAREEAERQAVAHAEQARREAAQKEQSFREWLASPIGQATAAKQAGQRFFELQMSVGYHEREAMWGSRDYASSDQVISSAGVIGEIERIGWHLEHAGYVFQMTGQSSTERFFVSGEQTSVSGVTVGIYLFRNTEAPA